MAFIGRLLWLIISLTAIALAMLFSTSNTSIITLQLWPFNGSLDLAVWVVALGSLGVGAVLGGGIVWMSLVAARARNWKLQRELGRTEKRAQQAEDALATHKDTKPETEASLSPSRMMLPR